MPGQSVVYRVLVAGPGDVARERKAVMEAIEAWTRRHGDKAGLVMQPIGWEQARPDLSGDPQAVINRQIGANRDAVLAVFGKRIGTATPRAISGTVEEIEEAIADGKDVMVYFASGPISRENLDLDQLTKLEEFRRSLKSRGLLGSYKSLPDLKNQLDDHITQLGYEVQERMAGTSSDDQSGESPQRNYADARLEDQAILKILPGDKDAGPWIYNVPDDRRAQVKYRLQNIGRAPARDVRATVTIGDRAPVEIKGPELLPSLAIAQREGFVLPLVRPFPGGAGSPVPSDYPDSDVISIAFHFSDFEHHLGEKQIGPFCFRFEWVAEGAQWRSRHLDPCPQRPRNLSADDHKVMETLVRLAARKPQCFQPVILTHRMGGNKQLYALDLVPDAKLDPEDKPNQQHYNDFIPVLLQQGFVIPTGHDMFRMDDSLFQAYGFERPT